MFYNWRKKYRGLGAPGHRRPRELRAENLHLEKLVADLSLDRHMLQDVLRMKL